MDLKKEAIKAFFGVLYTILIIFVIRYYKLSFWGIYALLMGTVIIWGIIKKDITLKNLIKTAVILFIIMVIMRLLSPFGIYGYIISILIICGLIMKSRWKQWLKAKHHIETMIWGEPLKAFIERGEKPPKLEIKR